MNWRLSGEGAALVISSGVVYLKEKHPKGLYLDEVLDMIKAHPGVGFYEKKMPKITTLGEVINTGKFDELGLPHNAVVSINLFHQEHDRDFPDLPLTGRQLLTNHYPSRAQKVDEG